MEENTPRFCQNYEKNEELESLFSFSIVYEKIVELNLIQNIIQNVRVFAITLDQNIKNQRQMEKLNLINLNYLKQV